MNGFTRAGALALGGAAVGGIVLGDFAQPATSKPSAKQDAEILNFVLLMEHVQSSFYAEGLSRGKLSGELLEFARTVGGQEKSHLAFVKQALGSAAQPLPKLDFGDDTGSADRFAVAAAKLEDLGVAAYNSQAPNLTKGTLAAAAKIVSVEARHAAWIRDLRGEVPAPDASEPTTTPDRVMSTLKGSGYIK